MLRSLIAVIAAILVGLVTAKFVEGAGRAGLGLDATAPTAGAYQVVLLAGWGLGAFAAAATANLIGRRWAALGWLAAASVFLEASVAMISYKLSWLLWPGTVIAIFAGGYLAARLLRAEFAYPGQHDKSGLFSG